MDEKKIKGRKRRKALSAILATAMLMVMLLSGTLAYFSRSVAVNQFSGMAEGKDVVGHDDFNPETGNKDIYMENLGSAPVYVRIRLSESFEISQPGGSSQQMTTYASSTSTANSRTYSKVDKYGNTIGNHIHGYCTKNTDIDTNGFAAADDPGFHQEYFKWTMGGADSQKTYLSANSEEYQNQATAPDALKYKTVTTKTDAEGTTKDTVRVVYDTTNDGNVYTVDESKPEIKTTPAQEEMIRLSKWNDELSNEEKYEYTGWILDDSIGGINGDGWYYWSQPLMGGEATGLLLDQVDTLTKLKSKDYSYNYNIYVEFEAVDETDKGLWLSDAKNSQSGDPWVTGMSSASHGGRKLVNFLSGKATYGNELGTLIDNLEQKDIDYQNMKADETQKENISYAAWGTIKAAMDSIASGDIETAFSLYEEALHLQESYTPGEQVILFREADTRPAEGATEPKIDPVLFQYLKDKEYDMDQDDAISKDEALAVRTIEINKDLSKETGIKTLNGITNDNFPNLTTLLIRNTEVTSVDGTKLPQKLETFWLTNTPIDRFDASKLTNLKDFAVSATNVTETTLTGLSGKKLVHLDIRTSKISSWDMHDTPTVEVFESGGKNPYDGKCYLATLDLSGAPNLYIASANANILQKIDTSCLSKVKSFSSISINGDTIKMVIHNEDQTFTSVIPTNADFIRRADGKIYNVDGLECDETTGQPVTP